MANPPNESIFRAIVERSSEGALVVDQRGEIVLVNPAIERLFGYTAAELLGQRVELLVPEARRALHALHRDVYSELATARHMDTGLAFHGRRKNGSIFPVDISIAPVTLDGRPVTVAAIRDLSALRAAQEALRRVLNNGLPNQPL